MGTIATFKWTLSWVETLYVTRIILDITLASCGFSCNVSELFDCHNSFHIYHKSTMTSYGPPLGVWQDEPHD